MKSGNLWLRITNEVEKNVLVVFLFLFSLSLHDAMIKLNCYLRNTLFIGRVEQQPTTHSFFVMKVQRADKLKQPCMFTKFHNLLYCPFVLQLQFFGKFDH
jgi:hypothetical protein